MSEPDSPSATAVETPRVAGLSVSGLCVVMAKSRIPVVDDVGFDIAQGSVMGLVGESGSGKSTVGLALLNHARRGLEISGGEVLLGTMNVLSLRGSALRRTRGRLVAYIPQDPATGLNPALRVGAQLREAVSIHKGLLSEGETLDDRCRALLDEVRLQSTKAILRSYPHQLSGGQQQRIGIAMAFACRPSLVVLDEPTTGLDVTTQRHVLDTIRTLSASYNVTAVYISHDLPVVAEIADHAAVMYAGRIVEYGRTSELFAAPRHPYTSRLLRAVPSPDRTELLTGIEGHPPAPGRWPPGCSFADRCEFAQDDCRHSSPALQDTESGRTLRCFHPLAAGAGDGAGGGVATLEAVDGRGLEIRNLVARYGSLEVLHNVEISVDAGACVAIVGESGSGKTTLARCLVGLHTNWSGTVAFDGDALATEPRRRSLAERKRVQYVFQNPYGSLNPRLSVGENVEEPLRYFERLGWRERRTRVADILEVVALGRAFADRMPGQLSGGERQRAAVARALVVDPDLLVCDEVTSALDVSVQALLVEQLRDLQRRRGLTMVFITHNLAVVRSIAQSVVVLEHGTVVESGLVTGVLQAPTHPYTRELLEDLPRLRGGAARLQSDSPAGTHPHNDHPGRA
jgi:peptide/nickel transport system ATP-binding protein